MEAWEGVGGIKFLVSPREVLDIDVLSCQLGEICIGSPIQITIGAIFFQCLSVL